MQHERDWTTSPAIAYRIEQGAELEDVITRNGTPDAGLVVMRIEGRRRMFRVRNAFGQYPRVREALQSEAEYHVREFAPEMLGDLFPGEARQYGRAERASADDQHSKYDHDPDRDDGVESDNAAPIFATADETEKSPADSRIEMDAVSAKSGTEDTSSAEPAASAPFTDESQALNEIADPESTEMMEIGVGEGPDAQPDETHAEETDVEGKHAGAPDLVGTPRDRADADERIERTSGPLVEEDGSARIEFDLDKDENDAAEEYGHGGDMQGDYAQMGGILSSIMG